MWEDSDMDHAPVTVDISTSDDLKKLADDVATSGVSRILVSGSQAIALVTPMSGGTTSQKRRKRRDPNRILDIIGIGASGGSDVANFKDDYIAEAVDHRGR
jgi:hypothetical protein